MQLKALNSWFQILRQALTGGSNKRALKPITNSGDAGDGDEEVVDSPPAKKKAATVDKERAGPKNQEGGSSPSSTMVPADEPVSAGALAKQKHAARMDSFFMGRKQKQQK